MSFAFATAAMQVIAFSRGSLYGIAMENLTIQIEEETLRAARRAAAARSTSIDKLVLTFLRELALDEPLGSASSDFLDLCTQSRARVGKITWSREELHARP